MRASLSFILSMLSMPVFAQSLPSHLVGSVFSVKEPIEVYGYVSQGGEIGRAGDYYCGFEGAFITAWMRTLDPSQPISINSFEAIDTPGYHRAILATSAPATTNQIEPIEISCANTGNAKIDETALIRALAEMGRFH